MEKKVLIAALLSALFLAVYSELVLKPQVRSRPAPSAPVHATGPNEAKAPASLVVDKSWLPTAGDEQISVITSSLLSVGIGQSSASIRHVVLKDFSGASADQPLKFSHDVPLFSVAYESESSGWRATHSTSHEVAFERNDSGGARERLTYRISEQERVVNVSYVRDSIEQSESVTATKLLLAWTRGDALSGKQNPLEMVALQQDGKHKKYHGPFKAPKDVPRGTIQLALSERYFASIVRTQAIGQVRALPSSDSMIAAEIELPEQKADVTLYFGPRDFFYLKKSDFQSAFPIGILGQIGLILLAVLGWIGSATNNYGLAVILFSVLVTCLTAPFTMMSFRSMKRMQELKPHIDQLMAKHKDDPKRANEEVFALYKTHKVNPLGGCLPIFLQMPIFFALIQAISHYVGLRGKSFVWIKDLSLPDRFAQLPFSIPFLGSDLNVLPFIMAMAMFLQTKISQRNMTTDKSNPTANMMSGPLMPIIFSIMLYHFPAALILYWITNSLMSMAWYRLAK